MNIQHSLKENIQHGTIEKPVSVMHFTTGPHTSYPENFFVQRHWHYEAELLVIRKGVYHLELNLENYRLAEGDICMVNSGELHMLEGLERDSCHDAVIFEPRILEFAYEDEVQKNLIRPFLTHSERLPQVLGPGNPGYERVKSVLDTIMELRCLDESGWYFPVKLRILELLDFLKREELLVSAQAEQNAAEKEKIDRYKRVAAYIEGNFQGKVTLEQLADAGQCNSHYLCRFFKDIAGVSPIQYLIRRRVEAACTMLRDTTRSVLEISLDCGFENVSYFIRQFKKITGKTPRQYRNME